MASSQILEISRVNEPKIKDVAKDLWDVLG
jgi:hypothetical protein